MSPRFRPPLWLVFVLLCSTLASCYVALQRFRLEQRTKAVHFAADIGDIKQLAAAADMPVPSVLSTLRRAGLTAVAIPELTFDDLVASGQLIPRQRKQATAYTSSSAELAQLIENAIKNQFIESKSPSTPLPLAAYIEQPIYVPLPARVTDLKGFSLGIDRESARLVQEQKLTVIARIPNPPVATSRAISWLIADAKDAGAKGVIPSGDQVLGRRELIPLAADEMKRAGIWFGVVEFANQGGLPRMQKEMLQNSLRVHSMVSAEIDRNELPDIVDRYVRAVLERNVKVVFLRPVSFASVSPVASFADFISAIRNGIERGRYRAKPAVPAPAPERPLWAFIAAAIGIATTASWLFSKFFSKALTVVATVIFVAIAAGAIGGYTTKYVALLGALTFPTWAILAALSSDNAGGGKQKWVFAFFWVSALSVAGGLHVSTLLTDLTYTMRLEQFFGVKAAHFIPPLIVACYLLTESGPFSQLLNITLRWVDVLLFAVFSGALAFMLIRTGNDSPTDVSTIELKMRTLLDHVLPERPRTKEFLVGHPALVLALGMAFRGDRKYLPLAGMAAAIGQASIVNTLSHLHTPLLVSVLRILTGILAGGIIGLLVLWVYNSLRKLPA